MDPVTGLPTRDRLVGAIDEMIAAGDEPVAFVVAIEGISAPDAGGDLEADSALGKALREVASRLSAMVRGVDVLAAPSVGRFGLAGSGIEVEDTAIVEQRIRGAFALPTDVGAGMVALSVSIGHSRWLPGHDGRALVAAAEANLDHKGQR
ncbi:MAG: diguanylate cyclase domain-containing protein [Microthrixaceae bacterium]